MDDVMEANNSYRLMRDYQTTVTILEHLSDAVFILNSNGNIQYANRVATDLLSQNLEDLLGKNLNDFLSHPFAFQKKAEADEEKSFLQQIYLNGLTEMESAFNNNGYQVPVIVSFGMVRDKQDEVQYIIASAKDMSWRKHLEKELMQKQLLAQSRDRYRELGELAINIVHRLSQPITSIQLLVEMMQKALHTPPSNPQQWDKNFEQIKEMLNLMSEVINNVRNFAFLTEKETLQPVRLKLVIENALQQLHYELTEAGMHIDLKKEEKLPGVLANAIHLQQVFMTLIRFFLDEAEKKGLTGAKTLCIKLHNANNRWVEVLVYDSAKKQNEAAEKEEATTVPLGQNFNLTVVQLILTSIGGDFSYISHKNASHAFLLRIPTDQSDDRQLLLNLIDLMKE